MFNRFYPTQTPHCGIERFEILTWTDKLLVSVSGPNICQRSRCDQMTGVGTSVVSLQRAGTENFNKSLVYLLLPLAHSLHNEKQYALSQPKLSSRSLGVNEASICRIRTAGYLGIHLFPHQ